MFKTVKNKIIWGFAFLLLLVVLTGAVSVYFLSNLRRQSATVLKANYESVEHVQRMQLLLDSIVRGKTSDINSFKAVLQQQRTNITEPGELQATQALQRSFAQLTAGDRSAEAAVRLSLRLIQELNMQAIRRKATAAGTDANEAATFLIAILSLILLVSFSFVFSFPSVITNSIQKLSEAIQEISRKNYRHRIHLQSKDEFGALANAFNEMAERLEYFESSNLAKILFEKSRAEAVINSLQDASIGVDGGGKVLFANNQAVQLLGLKSADIVGADVAELSRRNDLFRFLWAEESKLPFKIVVDDHENYFTKEVIELTQQDNRSKVIVLKNITSFKELDVAKTAFIATISHELKTPLASSDFALKLLTDERTGNLTAEQKELVENLRLDNQRMLRILSELLNMAQVEAGKILMSVEAVPPQTIVTNAVSAVQNVARQKSIIITQHIAPALPPVQADAEKTAWVLHNFLSNAIKYSPQGGTVAVHVFEKDATVVFGVQDSGPGIAAEYLPKIFERFFQVPGTSGKGTGLGLSISKEFIEAEGGSIWVQSEIGKGSFFYFSLPQAAL